MRLTITKTVRGPVPTKKLSNLLTQAGQYQTKKQKKLINEELSLVFVGEVTMRRLNEMYRNEKNVTDVLSFDYGEVVICYPRAVRQARRHRISIEREILALFVHALLHVFGYDHESKKDRRRMQSQETTVLGRPGLITLQGYAE